MWTGEVEVCGGCGEKIKAKHFLNRTILDCW